MSKLQESPKNFVELSQVVFLPTVTSLPSNCINSDSNILTTVFSQVIKSSQEADLQVVNGHVQSSMYPLSSGQVIQSVIEDFESVPNSLDVPNIKEPEAPFSNTYENNNNIPKPVPPQEPQSPSLIFYNCSKCEALFRTEKALNNHLETDHTYKCSICNVVLSSKQQYEDHVQSTHLSSSSQKSNTQNDQNNTAKTKVNAHPCDQCNKSFPNLSRLNRHKVYHQGIKNYKCESCDSHFYEKGALTKHVATHVRKDIPCPDCDKKFKNERTLKKHMVLHTERTPYICDICSKIYSTQEGLKVHSFTHAENGSDFKCPECGKDCKTLKYLNLHLKCKHKPDCDSTKHKCDQCGKLFKWLKTLKDHQKINHGPESETHLCHVCDKKFVNLHTLRQHMAKHENIRQFSCHICGEKFKYRSTERNHLKTVHSDVRKFQCNVCGKLFKTNSYLETHIQSVHASTERVKCDQCDKEFKTMRIMQNHVEVCHKKTRANNYKCSYCTKAFSSPKDKLRHEKIHTGVKDHVCGICYRPFARADNLKAHILKHINQTDQTQ